MAAFSGIRQTWAGTLAVTCSVIWHITYPPQAWTALLFSEAGHTLPAWLLCATDVIGCVSNSSPKQMPLVLASSLSSVSKHSPFFPGAH